MTFRTVWILALASTAGIAAVLTVNKLLVPRYEAENVVTIAAAKRDLLVFEVITMELIEPKEIQKQDYREGEHFIYPIRMGWTRREFEAQQEELRTKLCGRAVLYAMYRGESVTDSNLAMQSGRGLAELIPEGKRAVSIDLYDVTSNVAGVFVRPHNYVDIVATNSKVAEAQWEAKTILHCVEVLAVDQRPTVSEDGETNSDRKLRSVTVVVNPEDVEQIERHRIMGRLTLSLRNSLDNGDAQAKPP